MAWTSCQRIDLIRFVEAGPDRGLDAVEDVLCRFIHGVKRRFTKPASLRLRNSHSADSKLATGSNGFTPHEINLH